MVSTTQVQNGFSTEIIQMILSGRTTHTLALRNAVLAIASFHRQHLQAAETYKLNALRQLSNALSENGPVILLSDMAIQLASIMMLCMFSV